MKLHLAAFVILNMFSSTTCEASESCEVIRFVNVGWADVTYYNAIAMRLLKDLGYNTEESVTTIAVAYQELAAGRADVFMGNWVPLQDRYFGKYYIHGPLEVLSTILTGAKFTLAVPDYVYDQGVTSFDDLEPHADLFGRRIFGIEAGSNEPLQHMIVDGSHGLSDWQIVDSSENAMIAQVARSIHKREWIVFLAWEPHPMNTWFNIRYLKGGNAEYGPNDGSASVRSIARPNFSAECPDVAQLLSNIKLDLSSVTAGIGKIVTSSAEPNDVALNFMRTHAFVLKD